MKSLVKKMAIPIIAIATLFAPGCDLKFPPQSSIYGNIRCSANNPDNSKPHNVYIVITENSGSLVPNGEFTIPSVKLPYSYSLNLPKGGPYKVFAEWDTNDDNYYVPYNPGNDPISNYPFDFSTSDSIPREVDFSFN